MKVCNVCGVAKSMNDFYANKKAKDGHQSCCKDCRRAYLRANAERVAQVNREYRLRTGRQTAKRRPPAKTQHERRLKRYGLTPADYGEIADAQQGACAICGHKPGLNDRALVIDHCHRTGVVRGLLCHRCNTGLGLLGDESDIVASALAYLKEATDE